MSIVEFILMFRKNDAPTDTMSHPRRLDSSATLLQEPQIFMWCQKSATVFVVQLQLTYKKKVVILSATKSTTLPMASLRPITRLKVVSLLLSGFQIHIIKCPLQKSCIVYPFNVISLLQYIFPYFLYIIGVCGSAVG
jgi:hypothetical protein